MDLLINASAREGLIDRAALSAELGRGWLRYVADELPPVDDPVLRQENANLTGHVGGSPKLTRARIAENTHALLRQVIAEFSARRARRAKSSYVVNVLNAHRRPRGGWRSERVRSAEVRVLLADVFDTATLNFDALERACGVRIRVKDISRGPRSEAALRSALRTFKPNLLMIRTGTIITRSIAQALASLPGCTAVIRPGVGIDNVYDGFETLSAAGIKVINEPYGNAFSVGEMTLHLVANGVQKTLLAPGPTQFKPEVFAVMSAYTYPASPSYRAAYRETVRRLRPWMDLGRDPLVLTTPSTGFMEAAITNLTAEGDRGFVVAHGKFGNRFIEIANATGRAVDALRVDDAEWGRVFSPADIARALREDARRIRKTGGTPYAFLCFQQNETSSGVAYRQDHLRAIVKAARAYNPDILILMDGVSGVGAHALEFRSLDIDAIIIGAQKALGVSSGITYAAVSRRAIARLLSFAGYRGTLARLAKDPRREQYLDAFETRQRTWYLSILRLLVEEESPREVPGIFHLLSTRASLRLMAAEGGKNAVVARHHRLAEYCRAEVKRLSLETLSHPPYQSDSVTPALTPAPQDATKLREELLNRYGFSVAGAQSDYWKSRLVRIGHVGYVTMSDVVRCMRAIRILLR